MTCWQSSGKLLCFYVVLLSCATSGIIEGCVVEFTSPRLSEEGHISLNITEQTRANSSIATFHARCADKAKAIPVSVYKEGTSEDGFYFDGNVLRNRRHITEPVDRKFEFNVIGAGLLTSSPIPVSLKVKVEILVVKGEHLNMTLTDDELYVETFRGVIPGTIIWSVGKPNLTVDIGLQTTHQYSQHFEVTPNKMSIATARNLAKLPMKFQLPISLYSNNQEYLPLNEMLTVELRSISEPVIISAHAVNTSYADVCWKPPAHGLVQKFLLVVTAENISITSDVYPIKGQRQVCAKVHSLSLDHTYSFEVRAVYNTIVSPPSGTYFYTHSIKDPCLSGPCKNNGECLRMGEFSDLFNCTCKAGYMGKTCQQLDPCHGVICQNGEVCSRLSDTAYLCACQGYSCSRLCQPNPCQHGGTCELRKSGMECQCPLEFAGTLCETPVALKCPVSTMVDVKGIFRWQEIPYGEVAYTDCPMSPSNSSTGTRLASRACVLNKDLNTVWLEQNISACPLSQLTDESVDQFLIAIGEKDHSHEDPVSLTKMTEVLVKIADTAAHNTQQSEKYIRAIDSVLEAEPNTVMESNTHTRLAETFEEFLAKVDLPQSGSLKLNLHNIKVEVREMAEDETRQGVTFTPSATEGENDQVSTIELPAEVFNKLSSSSYRVKFVLYNNNKLFPVGDNGSHTVERVFLAKVNNESVSNLQQCVKYSLPKSPGNTTGGVYKCVYWNEKESTWSSGGVSKLAEDDKSVQCCANHLTNFAILLEVDPSVDIGEFHTEVLSIVSYVGSGLSITGLTLTLITYSIFPCLHRSKSGQILLNLGSSMLCMHFLFLIGGDNGVVENKPACIAIAVLLHYSVVSTLVWMGIEAMNLYRLLVRVFAMYEKRFLLKRMLIGWGVPVLLVVISVSVDLDNYHDVNKKSCLISSRNLGLFYGTYIAPVCLVLLCNLIVFIILLRVLMKPKFDNSMGKRTVTGAQIRGVLSVLVLLGLSWLFGVLAIGKAKVTLQYLFVVTTSMQGFCIFIFRCLRNCEAQSAWRQLWYEGTIKTRRGAIIKTSGPTHTTSTMSMGEKTTSHHSMEKRPISETEETLHKHFHDEDMALDFSKLGRVGSEKGTFWLNKYRLIMGLEKDLSGCNNNSGLKM